MISWMTDYSIPSSSGTSAQMEVFRYWNSKVRVTYQMQSKYCISYTDCSRKHGRLHCNAESSVHHITPKDLCSTNSTETGNLLAHWGFILIMLMSCMSAQISSQGQSRWLYGCWLSTSTYMIVCKCWSSVPFHAPTSLPRSNQKDKRKPKGTGGKHGKVQEPTFYWPKSMVQHMDHYTACFQVPNRYITK